MAVRTRSRFPAGGGGGGSGLFGLVGAMFGAPTLGGGGFTPAVNPEQMIQGDIKSSGADLTDEDASIDANNRARTKYSGVKAAPANMTPYTVQNPMMDALLNRGGASQQAQLLNAQQNQMLFQQSAMQQQQDAIAKAAMDRQVVANQGQLEGIEAQGTQTRKTLDRTHDDSLLAGKGISSSGNPTSDDAVRQQIASAKAAAELEATKAPTYSGDVAGSVRAGLQAQQAENFSKTKVSSAPGERVTGAFGMSGAEPGRPYVFPGSDNSEAMVPKIITVDGKPMQIGTEKLTQNIPRSGGYLDEIEGNRNKMLKAAQGSKVQASAPSIASPVKVAPAPVEDTNTALLPSIGRGIGEAGSSIGEGASDTFGPLLDMIMKQLINSNYQGPKRKPVQAYPSMRYGQ